MRENFKAVFQWARGRGDGERLLRLAGALADFWYLHFYLREGREQLEAALAHTPRASESLRAKVLVGAGTLAVLQGDGLSAKALLRQSLQAEVVFTEGLSAIADGREQTHRRIRDDRSQLDQTQGPGRCRSRPAAS